MKTLGETKLEVAGYLNRSVESFSENGFDVLTSAINKARNYAQSFIDLEYAKTSVYLEVSIANGASLSSTTLMGSSTVVGVKTIKAAYLYDANQPPTYYGAPIPFYNRFVDRNRTARNSSVNFPPSSFTGNQYASYTDLNLYQHGNTVYFSKSVADASSSQSIPVALDVVAWLPPLVLDTDTDFLLTYGDEFILLKSVQLLNYFLKEDQRVQLSQAAVQQGFSSLVTWNDYLIRGEETDLN